MRYADPGQPGSKLTFKARYDNFIGGEWVPPVAGQYFDNTTPVTGKVFCQVARSQAADIELALDAAHKAREGWARTCAGAARRPAVQDRRPPRSQYRVAGRRRNLGKRQTGA
jgi:aldehyde dehydrogenase